MKTIYRKSDNIVIGTEEDCFIENDEFGITDFICKEKFLITKFNANSNEFYEGASQEEKEIECQKEIDFLDEQTTATISKLLSKHVEKLATRQIPIPKEILEQQQQLIDDFHKKVNEIKEKYK